MVGAEDEMLSQENGTNFRERNQVTVKLLINWQELWQLRCRFNISFTVKFLPMAGWDAARVHQQPAGRAVGRN